MGKAIVINATERLHQTVLTHDENGDVIETMYFFKTFNDDTGEVIGSRSSPVIVTGSDIDQSKKLEDLVDDADTKKTADDAAVVAAADAAALEASP